eukprot:4594649-Amphidinium_carterae.1
MLQNPLLKSWSSEPLTSMRAMCCATTMQCILPCSALQREVDKWLSALERRHLPYVQRHCRSAQCAFSVRQASEPREASYA